MDRYDIYFTMDGKISEEEVIGAFQAQKKEDTLCQEEGLESAGFHQFKTLTIGKQILKSFHAAYAYCLANSRQSYNAVAVRYRPRSFRLPFRRGERYTYWVIAGWVAE